MPFDKTGPISQDEFFELWKSVVDREGYASPLVVQPDSGIELIQQSHAQLAAVSSAVDETFQSLFILPHSGQSNESAAGGSFATVQIQITRTNLSVPAGVAPGSALVFAPDLRYLHAPTDYSEDGPIQVFTGRRYFGVGFAVLSTGKLGPITVTAESEFQMSGYNLPQPGTIVVLDQPGSTFSNTGASVQSLPSSNRLTLRAEPEVLTPDQIGQYILFTAGANVNHIARMVGYEPSSPGNGGVAILAAEAVLFVTGVVGTFVVGETVSVGTATATFIDLTAGFMVLLWLTGAAAPGAVTGTLSGATATAVAVSRNPALVNETDTAAWRVLSWVELGVSVTNPASPTGGRTPVLDTLGAERNVFRSPGETDETYRERVATPADVVSPNAIVRAMNRALLPFGVHGCFREVGSKRFPGLFFDGDPTSTDPAVAFAYDLDFDTRPEDRYKLLLDYTEFRAFFVIAVPPLGEGEFGVAFDEGDHDAFDAIPFDAFFDGFPAGDAEIYLSVFNNVDAVKAGGVSFAIVLDGGPCTP